MIEENKKLLEAVLAQPEHYEVQAVRLCVYAEKDKNANPYYVSNERLVGCSAAVLEIFDAYSPQSALDDYDYLMKNNVFLLEELAGGHRTPITKDTQIKFLALLKPHTPKERFFETVEAICQKHGVTYTEAM